MTVCKFRNSCGYMSVSSGYFSIIKIKCYCWKGVQLFKRKEPVSKSVWKTQKQAITFHEQPETTRHTFMWMWLFILTCLFFFFPWSFNISSKYNMTLRSLGKTCIVKHNYIDLCFWLVTRFISLWDIIMSWICWSQYVSCQ